MKILFHLPTLPPKRVEFEAYAQEIAALSDAYGGYIAYLNPNRHLPSRLPLRIPRLLFGFSSLPTIRRLEPEIDVHQIFNPDPYFFPVLALLKKPLLYVLSGNLIHKKLDARFFRRLAAVAVYDERNFRYLKRNGIQNAFRIQAGVRTERLTHQPVAGHKPFHLLMASAPWSEAHFKSKGIDALLQVAQRMPQLHLTLLWRDVLLAGIEQRIARLGVERRVTVINEFVDINDVLGKVHGTILLAATGDEVKAHPHSLLDSMAAGKPVIVSRSIPLSDYVGATGTGVVVEELEVNQIISAIEQLSDQHDLYQCRASKLRANGFTLDAMIQSYGRLYAQMGVMA